MTSDELKSRIRRFAIRVLKMSDHLPKCCSAMVISRQVARSSSSAGANYRAACRSKSPGDFINKLKIVEEELDKTDYWLVMIEEMGFLSGDQLKELTREANELLSIIVKSLVTAKTNQRVNARKKEKLRLDD
jgi:four helix bundle protein